MGPPPPEPFPDEIVEEILVRVAPDDPASLARAAASSKPWCRIVTAPAFRTRFLGLHRGPPPLLGFLCDLKGPVTARFVPTSTFRPPRADHRGFRPHDARHGRVLLRPHPSHHAAFGLVVWDPVTDERTKLPRPPLFASTWRAAVLCAAAADGTCDHLDCHRGPFIVVYVLDHHREGILTCVYSSEAGTWSKPVYDGHRRILRNFLSGERGALAKNALHFMIGNENSILRCNLRTLKMSVIHLPRLHSDRRLTPPVPIMLTTMEDGRLGFAVVEGSRFCLWSIDGGELGWLLVKVIDLKKLLPLDASSTANPRLLGFAEGVGVIFLSVGNEIFTVDLKSTLVNKVYEGSGVTGIIPYMTLCTPVMGVPSTDDGSGAGGSTDQWSCVASGLRSQGK